MKMIFVSAVLLLACSSMAHAGNVREQFYTVGADVDMQGHVTATQLDPDVPAPLASVLSATVKNWQFVPAKRNEQAVDAHTFVRVRLQAIPNSDGKYRLRISFAGNGPRLYNQVRPHYPKEAFHARESAFVFLDATAQPDGRLTDLVASSQFEAWPIHIWFKNSVVNAASHWHTQPELVGGQPVATHIRISVNFVLSGSDFTNEQVQILRNAAKRDATQASQSGVPLPSEQELSLDSPLHPSAVATTTSAP